MTTPPDSGVPGSTPPERPQGSAFSSADYDKRGRKKSAGGGYSSSGYSSSGYSSAGPALTPEQQKRKKIKIAAFIALVVVGVAFGAGWNPPTRTVHKFTKASDYNLEKDTGCVNSGAGCHGKETSYNDFNAYHPEAVCLDCHDYQGVACIPCHMPREHECALCHDGSMKNAPDVVRLSDPFPKGHYRETSHTAVGTPMNAPVVADPESPAPTAESSVDPSVAPAAGEPARVACKQCHSRDLRTAHTDVPALPDSPYGTTLGCGECHNDVRSKSQAVVLDKWKKHQCEACHGVGSAAPMHSTNVADTTQAESPLGCGESGPGCHEGNQLHALHAFKPTDCSGAASDGEPVCHTLGVESLKPTVKTCGGTDTDTSCHPAVGGTYQHDGVNDTHAPSNGVAAADTSYYGTACGDCHRMAPDGVSLIREHELATSEHSGNSDECVNCHANDASVEAVADAWPQKSGAGACEACHGKPGLDPVHTGDVSSVHTVKSGSAGCASSGPGCHPTDDISEVGQPSTSSNIHATCLRCHDWTKSDGNLAYDPNKKTCGSGRDCHGAAGAYEPSTGIHDGAAGRIDGTDGYHKAGSAQRTATFRDVDSGVSTACGACHQMTLGSEHTRANSSISTGDTCTRCHNATNPADVVKADWPSSDSPSACAACHSTVSPTGLHGALAPKHVGIELGPDGTPSPGACAKAGCHGTTDLRKLHRSSGCTATGCHTADGPIFGRNVKSCGGGNGLTACHVGYSAQNHFVSHRADLSGTHSGIDYVAGANSGCFGCHDPDLVSEHARELAAGSMDGSADGSCHVCHADPDSAGSGTYASTSAVRDAIADTDLRCKSCHANGGPTDGPDAVAGAHRRTTTANPLPDGYVWADPFSEWKAAFDGPTGGGHNVVSASLVGGRVQKAFPITGASIGGTDYVWALPPNTGTTTWLKASQLGTAAVETTESIQHITITCADCHAMPADMVGPHGSSVHVGIDPAYSQTEYANPTPNAYQFRATGTERVVCVKCHNMEASDALTPGGHSVHARHVAHDSLPVSNPGHYGNKCIDCHVRIPHAWKRPRLLIRTAVTTDGVTPDAYPYIAQGHNGLAGVTLRSYSPSSQLRSRYCATNGCHPNPSSTRHPLPSQVTTMPFWP